MRICRRPRATQCHDVSTMRPSSRPVVADERKPVDRWALGPQSSAVDLRIQCLCIDTTDPARLASFWQSALGWRRTYEREEEVVLEPPAGAPEDGVVPDL